MCVSKRIYNMCIEIVKDYCSLNRVNSAIYFKNKSRYRDIFVPEFIFKIIKL